MSYWCNNCNRSITDKEAGYSKKNFNQYLCMTCQRAVTGARGNYGNHKAQDLTKRHEVEAGSRFPSHTILYRDFHKLAPMVIRSIFEKMGWKFHEEPQGLFKAFGKEKYTTYAYEFEERGWDIVIKISVTPEKLLTYKAENGDISCFPLLIEYKSSIEEWGKQFDDYIRQMKRRIEHCAGVPILLSFDERFNDFTVAAQTAGFCIVTIPLEACAAAINGFDQEHLAD